MFFLFPFQQGAASAVVHFYQLTETWLDFGSYSQPVMCPGLPQSLESCLFLTKVLPPTVNPNMIGWFGHFLIMLVVNLTRKACPALEGLNKFSEWTNTQNGSLDNDAEVCFFCFFFSSRR